MKDDFDAKINRDLDRFLDIVSIEEMFDIVKDMLPFIELNEMMGLYDQVDDDQEREELSAQLFSRAIYLFSKFSSQNAGRLSMIKSVFPDLHKRMEEVMPK